MNSSKRKTRLCAFTEKKTTKVATTQNLSSSISVKMSADDDVKKDDR